MQHIILYLIVIELVLLNEIKIQVNKFLSAVDEVGIKVPGDILYYGCDFEFLN